MYSFPSLPGSFNPAISGQQATPGDWNTLAVDLTSAMSSVITVDGQSTVTGNIPFGGFKLTGVGAGTAQTDAVNVSQLTANVTYAADTGAADAYVIAPAPVVTAYIVGQTFQFKPAHTNATTTPTLAVSGLTAGTIVNADGSAVAPGALIVGTVVDVYVSAVTTGTPTFQLQTTTALTQVITDNSTKIATTAFANQLMRSYLAGLTLSTAGGSATFGIAAGIAENTTAISLMRLASAYTKTTSAWAVGSGNGSLDTGSVANTTWYTVFLIQRADTGVVDVLTSLSATAPTLPTNYTLFRRIGAMKTDGSAQWIAFIQDGDLFQWLAPVADISAADPGTSAVTRTLTVPTGVNVLANVQMIVTNSGAAAYSYGYLSDLATTDTAASLSLTDTSSAAGGATGGVIASGGRVSVRTNTTAQIRSRISFSDVSCSLKINTLGWSDRRGRDA